MWENFYFVFMCVVDAIVIWYSISMLYIFYGYKFYNLQCCITCYYYNYFILCFHCIDLFSFQFYWISMLICIRFYLIVNWNPHAKQIQNELNTNINKLQLEEWKIKERRSWRNEEKKKIGVILSDEIVCDTSCHTMLCHQR